MANEVVGIEIRAELAGLRADLAKIPEIGGKEARAMASALSREIKRAERASAKAAEQSKKTAAAMRSQTRATREVAKETKSLGDRLLGAGAGLAAVLLTAEKIKQAFSAVAEAVEEITANEPQVRQFSDTWRETRDAVMVPLAATVTGIKGATAEMMDEMRRTDGWQTFAGGVSTAFYDVAIPAFAATAQTVKVLWEGLRALGDTMVAVGDVFAIKSRVIAKVLAGDFQGAVDVVKDTADGLMEIPDVFSDAAREIAASAETLGEWTESASRQARAAVESIKATSRLTQEQKFAKEEAEEGAKVVEAAERTKQKAIEETLKVRQETAQQEMSITTQVAQIAINTAVSVSESIIDGLQQVALKNVQEARRRAQVELGFAILRGELQAAGAFGTTLATYGATPQGFALAAAAAAAVGIQSKAAAAAGYAAASEYFHSGGFVSGQSASSEVPATLRPGEYVVSNQGVNAIGRGTLDLINAGQAPSGPSVVAVVVDHKVAGAVTSKAMQDPGSGLSQRLASLAPVAGGYAPHG